MITAEKAVQLELLRRRMIEEIMDYAIILLDLDGTVLTWNAGAESIKGYKPSEIIGQNFELFYLPEDRMQGIPRKLIQEAMRNGRAKYIGKRVRKDGTIFWGSMLLTALHDDNNNVIGFTKLTKEISDTE
jgi:PAS domain S-box-containing protein